MVEATEAHTMGLVNYIVVEPDELLTETRKLLSIINGKAPLAVARIIEAMENAGFDVYAQHQFYAWGCLPSLGSTVTKHGFRQCVRFG